MGSYEMLKKLSRKIRGWIYEIDSELGQRRMPLSPKRNLHNIMWERAIEQSADFVEAHLSNSLLFRSKTMMFDYVTKLLSERHTGGLCLEFGVASGRSINRISKSLPQFDFVGFDSFVGIKEDWKGHHAAKGAYSQNGRLPEVNKNVELVVGWFDETLPEFIEKHDSPIANLRLLHVDSDTYEAAAAIFKELGGLLKPGTLVLFDELIGYPNWKNGEYRALIEAQTKFGLKFEYRAFSSEQALIEIVP